MANDLKLPDGYVLYDYQVAGHTFSENIEELGKILHFNTYTHTVSVVPIYRIFNE